MVGETLPWGGRRASRRFYPVLSAGHYHHHIFCPMEPQPGGESRDWWRYGGSSRHHGNNVLDDFRAIHQAHHWFRPLLFVGVGFALEAFLSAPPVPVLIAAAAVGFFCQPKDHERLSLISRAAKGHDNALCGACLPCSGTRRACREACGLDRCTVERNGGDLSGHSRTSRSLRCERGLFCARHSRCYRRVVGDGDSSAADDSSGSLRWTKGGTAESAFRLESVVLASSGLLWRLRFPLPKPLLSIR